MNDKLMPLNPEPSPAGNVELVTGDKALVHTQPTMDQGERYLSHFVTCPDRDKWRKNSSRGGVS